MYRHIITILTCLTVLQPALAKNPTALELLDKYAEMQDQYQSFRVKVSTSSRAFSSGLMTGKPWKARYFSETVACFDKNRAKSRTSLWGKVNQKDYFPKNKPQ